MSMFFEGPEKKVELAVVDGYPSLRALDADFWRSVVAAARAEVLSERSNAQVDGYLLSESSLFVFDQFVTMITCGRTTLVDAVERMLQRVDRDAVSVLVYERKNEHFPQLQPTTFHDDARRLRGMLPGRAVRFGVEHEHAVRMFHTTRQHEPEADDRTLEVLMHGIDAEVAARFAAGAAQPFRAARELPGVLDGYLIDEFRFQPYGYSANALKDGFYATLHVTPQAHGSYVSFETNDGTFGHDPGLFVRELVELFRPEAFDVVAFEPDADPVQVRIDGYSLRKHVSEPVSGYTVTFQHFFRPSVGVVRAHELTLD
jgi:S-adenosylmethionine decarboxylase